MPFVNRFNLRPRVASRRRNAVQMWGVWGLLGPICLGLLAGLPGCLTASPEIVACPWTESEQVREICEKIPLGASRSEVENQLKELGIRGNFNENQNVFYCDVWQRQRDLWWHINVSLLFNERGEFYATRPELIEGTRTEQSADSTDARLPKSKARDDQSDAEVFR